MNIVLQYILTGVRHYYRKVFKPSKKVISCETNASDASSYIYQLLTDDKPCMIARYGSTELACICNYISINETHHSWIKYIKGDIEAWWWNKSIMQQMQQWSGFFPSTEEKLSAFCRLILDDTTLLDTLGCWIPSEKQLEGQLKNVYRIHLHVLEPFWCDNPWTKALEGKRVVVVHPFSKIIEEQYLNHRKELFANPSILPEFQLRTIKAVQSLGGENNGFKDWFEALDWMKHEIDKEDYDIALIGCGAYGFPLAAHCKRQGKKAVHLGGALQLLFGIRGNRWDDPMYGVKEWGLPIGMYSELPNEHWARPGNIGKPKNAEQVEGACYW